MTAARAAFGIGLRAPHYARLAETRPPLELLEVHAENFFGAGGAALSWLQHFRRDYALSLHGVGLSLGSVDPLDHAHLARLKALADRFQPLLVSEHLSWSSFGGRHANDLLPLPFSREAARHVAGRIRQAQDFLGRELLIENVSAYAELAPREMAENEFVMEVVRESGCRLLLDLNNVHVNAVNFGFDARAYLQAIDPRAIAQYHLGGFEATPVALIDTHGAPASDEVLQLYALALERSGPRPTLVEWDTDIPPLETLLRELDRARAVAERSSPARASPHSMELAG